MFGLTPGEVALAINAITWAITQGSALFDALQIKELTDLLAKLQAQLAQVQQDRATANADIDARDKALEAELAKKP